MFKSHLYHQMVVLCSCFFYVAMVIYDKLGILRDIPMSQAYSVPFTRTEIDYFSQPVQLLSHVRLPATPWTTAHQASLSITNSWSLPTHVHWVGNVIQPYHPLLSPSPPDLNLSQQQGLFKWVSSSYQVAKVWEFQL